MRMTASFFSTIGYVSSQPIDTGQICQQVPNGTSCNFKGYDLGPGEVVVGIATWGEPLDPIELWQRPSEGRRVQIGGMPGNVVEEVNGDRRQTTWKVAFPTALTNWLQLDVDTRGPGNELVGAQIAAVIGSVRFNPPPIPIDPTKADEAAANALRQLRQNDAEQFACFPSNGQSIRTSVTAAPGAPLRQALVATCTTRISATDLGFWRLELVVAWGADPAQPDHRYTTVQWIDGTGTLSMQSSRGDNLPNCCRGGG
jgi:hypothetical protein